MVVVEIQRNVLILSCCLFSQQLRISSVVVVVSQPINRASLLAGASFRSGATLGQARGNKPRANCGGSVGERFVLPLPLPILDAERVIVEGISVIACYLLFGDW